MLLIIALVLLVLWIGGFVVYHGAHLALHLLLVFAIISAIFHFISGRRSA